MRKRRDMDSPNTQQGLLPSKKGVKDSLYTELWRACAGSFVYVPREEETVLYFPQGHLEQVAAYTQHQQDGHMEIPVYDLPSKILCKIMHIELKAEAFSDEVYAQVTLVPALKQDNLRLEVEENDQIPSITTTYTFSKILTPSDTSTHGGFSVPKKHADECFPPLDMTQQTPAQEIVAKDLNGFEWHFRHIYRGKPKRHLLTSGWSTFVNAKKLVAGDSCIFVRAESGEIRVGIRRATEHLSNVSQSSSLISGHSMQLGILASASHAVSSGTMFIVYYHPWTNPFEFIVPLRTYLKSTVPDYPIGMRVQMQHEVEESLRRHAGTIIGHEDIDKIRWPGSEWRCLKVQWDAVLDDKMNPERVCPWWIEPLESAKEKKQVPALPTTKKALALNQRSLPGISSFGMHDGQNSAGPSSQTRREDRDLQGQDYSGIHSAQPLQRAPPTDVIHPSKVPIRGSRFGKENPNQLPFPMQGPLHKSLSRSMSLTHEDLSITSSNLSSIGSESLGWPSTESRNENDVPFGQPGSCSTFKLFGVSLIDRSSELPSLQSAAFNKTSSLLSNPPMRVAPGKTCKKCHRLNKNDSGDADGDADGDGSSPKLPKEAGSGLLRPTNLLPATAMWASGPPGSTIWMLPVTAAAASSSSSSSSASSAASSESQMWAFPQSVSGFMPRFNLPVPGALEFQGARAGSLQLGPSMLMPPPPLPPQQQQQPSQHLGLAMSDSNLGMLAALNAYARAGLNINSDHHHHHHHHHHHQHQSQPSESGEDAPNSSQ